MGEVVALIVGDNFSIPYGTETTESRTERKEHQAIKRCSHQAAPLLVFLIFQVLTSIVGLCYTFTGYEKFNLSNQGLVASFGPFVEPKGWEDLW